MTPRSVIRNLRRLMAGDSWTWRHLGYLLRMKFRGVDLTWLSAKESGLREDVSYAHASSGGPALERLLDSLSISPADSVLDIGCGKGGAMITLARYPFARVDGVELAPNLAEIAQANLKRLHIANASVFCCDAAELVDLDPYNYFYLYNPFGEEVLRPVLQNIRLSLIRQKRHATLIYDNPTWHNLVLEAGFHKVKETHRYDPRNQPFSIYVADSRDWSASLNRPA